MRTDVRSENVQLMSGVSLEVRELSAKEQYEVLDRVLDENGDIDSQALAVESIIASTYDPKSGERVFEDSDRQHLHLLPSADFFALLKACVRLQEPPDPRWWSVLVGWWQNLPKPKVRWQ